MSDTTQDLEQAAPKKWGMIRINRDYYNRYKAAASLFDCTHDQFMGLVLEIFQPVIDEAQAATDERLEMEAKDYEARMKRVRNERIARLKAANLERAAAARKRRLQAK